MKNIKIIFTGGTIAMRTNEIGMLLPAVSGAELIAAIPTLQKIAHISTEQFSNIPSAQMTPELMLALRNSLIDDLSNNEISGVVVVHGTDTMEETAFFLDATLTSHKPVVLTGAMRSNDQNAADGAANLLAAVQVAVDNASSGRGVMVVMNGEIHAARHVQKMNASSINAFASPHHEPLGISSQNSGVHFYSAPCRFTPMIDVSRETLIFPRVDVVPMYTGADAALLNASIAAGARAIIVQAVGASSVNLELYDGIHSAIEQGVTIVIACRPPLGLCVPIYGYKGGGQTLAQLGALFAHDLPAHKARLYAMLLLGASSIANGFAQLADGSADWAIE